MTVGVFQYVADADEYRRIALIDGSEWVEGADLGTTIAVPSGVTVTEDIVYDEFDSPDRTAVRYESSTAVPEVLPSR